MTLDDINTREDIRGYILKSSSSASVDLKDSSKIVDYAVLTTEAFEFSQDLSRILGLGETGNVVVEGKDVKILCLTIDEQRLSIFMEKTVDHKSIYKELTQ